MPVRARACAVAALVLLTAAVGACHRGGGPVARAQYLNPGPPSGRPFSAAVRVGNMLYLSGKVGTLANGQLAAGGIAPETRQALENIRDVLTASGSSLDRVVKCTVMMADMREWDAMNTVYAAFFPKNKPARSAFGTSGLALGARVEIECLATVE